jgi:small-conductance mechanosensitive channel
MDWNAIAAWRILGNPAEAWILALLAAVAVFTVVPLVRGVIRQRRKAWAQAGTEPPLAVDLTMLLVERTTWLFQWTVALYFAFNQLVLPYRIQRAIEIAIVVTFWLQMGLWAMAAVRFGLERRRHRAGGVDPQLAGSFQIINFVAGLLIWAIAFLLALDNLGVAIGPLLAGLGIGGIAVALAVQTVLSDLLASMSIALDKPFAVGDFLIIDTFLGTVEYIGVKSTRLRSLSGEQIVMSNADILKSRVRNYGRMKERRVNFSIGVTYDTSLENLRAIPGVIRELVEAQEGTRFDRCHFLTYGDSSLTFETVYFVLAPDFNSYANRQQAINLELFRRFREMGVSFAFPTRTLHIETGGELAAAALAAPSRGEQALAAGAHTQPAKG